MEAEKGRTPCPHVPLSSPSWQLGPQARAGRGRLGGSLAVPTTGAPLQPVLTQGNTLLSLVPWEENVKLQEAERVPSWPQLALYLHRHCGFGCIHVTVPCTGGQEQQVSYAHSTSGKDNSASQAGRSGPQHSAAVPAVSHGAGCQGPGWIARHPPWEALTPHSAEAWPRGPIPREEVPPAAASETRGE